MNRQTSKVEKTSQCVRMVLKAQGQKDILNKLIGER